MLRSFLLALAVPLVVEAQAAPVADTTHYLDIAVTDRKSCALRADGAVFCWGLVDRPLQRNDPAGKCGIVLCDLKPIRMAFNRPLKSFVSPGCGLTTDSDLACYSSDSGVKSIAGEHKVLAAGFGYGHDCIIEPDGSAWCRGAANDGQLGIGSGTMEREGTCIFGCRIAFTRVVGSQTWTAMHAGDRFTCALASDKKTYCWGGRYNGRVGDGTGKQRDVPTPVAGNLTFASLALGGAHACGLTDAGAAHCWGKGKDGQLGNNAVADVKQPSPVAGDLVFKSLYAGSESTCGLTADGKAYCWGKGEDGRLGSGVPTKVVPAPALIPDFTFSKLAVGGSHACGISTDRTAIHCWGKNGSGQLGIAIKVDNPKPTKVVFP